MHHHRRLCLTTFGIGRCGLIEPREMGSYFMDLMGNITTPYDERGVYFTIFATILYGDVVAKICVYVSAWAGPEGVLN